MPLTRPQIGFKLILCDAAQTDAATGKIHMLGAGWTITSSPTAPHAVALMIQVPWDRTNQKLLAIISAIRSEPADPNTQCPPRSVRHAFRRPHAFILPCMTTLSTT